MKIAFIGARGVVGKYSGIETYYEEVGSRLVSLGHDVTVYCRSYFTPAVRGHRGMRVRRLPTIRGKHLETWLHSALATADALFRGYDGVQFHALGSAPFALLPRAVGAKTVVSVRGLDGRRAKWGAAARAYLTLCEQASVRFPDATVVVSRQLRHYYSDRYGAPVTFIPNGVTLREPRGAEALASFGLRGRDYILYVGRLTPEKDCHLLVDAFERLDSMGAGLEARQTMKLVFVGGSTYAGDYVERLTRHASDRILFLGFQTGETLEALFSQAYLYVLPSRIEGQSISLLEAMGWGNGVLVSDIPENREVVEGCGLTFRTGDVEDLRQKLVDLIASPETVDRAGRAARARIARDHAWDAVARRTEAMFRQLVAGGTRDVESGAALTQPSN